MACVRLFVRPSVTRRYCIQTVERIELIFDTEKTLGLSYIVLEGNSGISKNEGTFV